MDEPSVPRSDPDDLAIRLAIVDPLADAVFFTHRNRGFEPMDELTESHYSREWVAWARHLHQAEAEINGWSPEPLRLEDGSLEWRPSTLAGRALAAALEFYGEHLDELYPRGGRDTAGFSYWLARDARDLLNLLLERHGYWRKLALENGYPTGLTDDDDDQDGGAEVRR